MKHHDVIRFRHKPCERSPRELAARLDKPPVFAGSRGATAVLTEQTVFALLHQRAAPPAVRLDGRGDPRWRVGAHSEREGRRSDQHPPFDAIPFRLGEALALTDRTLEVFELRDGEWVFIASAKDGDLVSIPPSTR